jgi:hypothetical protein
MNLHELLLKFEDLNKIPKKRLIKELNEMDLYLRNKILDIQVRNCKQIIDITFDFKPHNIILHLPRYYPFRPITCKVKVVPISKNQLISKILNKKLPYDLVRYNSNQYTQNIWNYIDNSILVDGKQFIYNNGKDNMNEITDKMNNYDKIYTDWTPGRLLQYSLEKYMECLEHYLTI